MLDFINENKSKIIVVIILIILVFTIVKLFNKNKTQIVNSEEQLMIDEFNEEYQEMPLDETQNMIYDDIVYGEDI